MDVCVYRLLAAVLLEELNEQPRSYITEWYTCWKRENKDELPNRSSFLVLEFEK